jgi:sugar phosphate isomerase/epimerase
MSELTRREFIHRASLATVAVGIICGCPAMTKAGVKNCKMSADLACGNLGVSASQREAIELAARHGFQSVGADGDYLAALGGDEVVELKSFLRSKGVVFGAAGLPLEFRRDEERFREALRTLPKFAAGLKRAGVDRVGTWVTPCDDRLTYVQNFRQHALRLREAAKVFKDYGIRLGLEYVGPKTSWASRRYPFIHTMAEMKELVAELNVGNVGFILDSWHWWHAGETAADVLSLQANEVIAVDLNDAPAGVAKDQQLDGRRELPCATGVIDVASFLKALIQIGYDGPVRAEPFNQAVRQMTKDEACEAASIALKKAFALVS